MMASCLTCVLTVLGFFYKNVFHYIPMPLHLEFMVSSHLSLFQPDSVEPHDGDSHVKLESMYSRLNARRLSKNVFIN